MLAHSRSQLIEYLVVALSLAESYEAQDPPNPITRAALQHTVQDVLAELEGAHALPSSDPSE
jgi:hypothetical protein